MKKSTQETWWIFIIYIRNQIALDVESPRIELGSKQATKEFSTRLFSDWIFDIVIGQKQPHHTYLLKFS